MKFRVLSALGSIFLITFLSSFNQVTAHTNENSQIPAKNSVLEVIPNKVTITFTDNLLLLSSANSIQILDPTGKDISTGEILISNNMISRTIAPSEIRGIYTVKYRVVAKDGHVISASYQFSLKEINSLANEIETVNNSFWNQTVSYVLIAISVLLLIVIWEKRIK